jgi:hypothetical protein
VSARLSFVKEREPKDLCTFLFRNSGFRIRLFPPDSRLLILDSCSRMFPWPYAIGLR